MAKKFKLKTYEKDNDDLYVVLVNPWTRGHQIPYSQNAVNWMSAFLRIAAGKADDDSLVVTVLTMDSRSEVIAQLGADADKLLLLGEHRWGQFMNAEGQKHVKRSGKANILNNTTQVFEYKWITNGDPSEKQWREWRPSKGPIPDESFLVSDFPRPSWIPVPQFSQTLLAIVQSIPKQEEEEVSKPPISHTRTETSPSPITRERDVIAPADAERSKENASARTSRQDAPPSQESSMTPSNFSPYQRPTQLQGRPAQAAEVQMIKAETEEQKPLIKAEVEERKRFIKGEDLDDSFLSSVEPEEQKPKIEEEDTRSASEVSEMLSNLVNEFNAKDMSTSSGSKRAFIKGSDEEEDENEGQELQIKRVKKEKEPVEF